MWAQLVTAFFMTLVSSLLTSLLTPTPRVSTTNAKPGEQEVPTTEESTGISVIFGTICKKDLTIGTYAGARTTPIIKYTSGGGGKK